MEPHESPRIRKKSIRGDSGDSWPVWNRGIMHESRKREIQSNMSTHVRSSIYQSPNEDSFGKNLINMLG